jgi:alanine-glyoxylate transaminase/serine-glyoxylate transaminase/serine-pyruvate transaminase
MAGRYGADRRRVEKTWGTSCFSLDEIKAALEQHKPKLLALVHGETSTGIKQEMEG